MLLLYTKQWFQISCTIITYTHRTDKHLSDRKRLGHKFTYNAVENHKNHCDFTKGGFGRYVSVADLGCWSWIIMFRKFLSLEQLEKAHAI